MICPPVAGLVRIFFWNAQGIIPAKQSADGEVKIEDDGLKRRNDEVLRTNDEPLTDD